ncbi:MAG: sigma-70 family RNA polymerase sigma factor [Spirochaetia bacterium]|nr:sigma-70 family RNA polymerase sigma factor [Spirochaetia bacterium]
MDGTKESHIEAVSRTNAQWTAELRSAPPDCNAALEELYSYLQKGLTAAFGDNKNLSHEDIQDFSQESEQKILHNLGSFRGSSKFTTWALKIAINHTISELRRKHWQELSLDTLEYPEALFSARRSNRPFEQPEKRALKHSLIEHLNQVIREDLTDLQRKAVTARFLYGVPPSRIAEELNSTRGAVYKLLHDSRLRLKAALEKRGMGAEETKELFD